jgi:hypothetical protein
MIRRALHDYVNVVALHHLAEIAILCRRLTILAELLRGGFGVF